MKTRIEVIGKCPHSNCKGNKVKETMTYKETAYPSTQSIVSTRPKVEMITKTKISYYCTTCLSVFKQ